MYSARTLVPACLRRGPGRGGPNRGDHDLGRGAGPTGARAAADLGGRGHYGPGGGQDRLDPRPRRRPPVHPRACVIRRGAQTIVGAPGRAAARELVPRWLRTTDSPPKSMQRLRPTVSQPQVVASRLLSDDRHWPASTGHIIRDVSPFDFAARRRSRPGARAGR